MEPNKCELFVLGATGFIGQEVVKEALARGCGVKALARSPEKAADLAAIGAVIISGDARNPTDWVREAAGCGVMIDLVQPALPARIGLKAVMRVSGERQATTRLLLSALLTIPIEDRPLLLSVSGLDDLAPDEHGHVHAGSPLRAQLAGFAHIGIPVRRLMEASWGRECLRYLGTVYGPGKAFAKTVFPQLAAGRFRMAGSGDNRMPLVHVEDAARALVYISALGRDRLSGCSFVIADGHQTRMKEFLNFAADRLGAPHPSSAPVWLARLFAGTVLCETLTRDIAADPSSITETGFEFRYPSYREGLPPTLERLGYPKKEKSGPLDSLVLFRVLFVLALGSLIAENCFDFPLSVPWMRHLAAGAPILDMRLGYSQSAVYQYFDVLGATGRGAYLRLLWTVDLILPLLFGGFLSVAIRRGAFRRLSWLPFLASACDYAENTAITFLLLHYPIHKPATVQFSSMFTLMKHAFYMSGLVLAIVGFAVRRAQARRVPSNVRPSTMIRS